MKPQETTKTVIKTTTTKKLHSYKTEPKQQQQQQNRLRWLNMLKCFFLFIKKKYEFIGKKKGIKKKTKTEVKTYTSLSINYILEETTHFWN